MKKLIVCLLFSALFCSCSDYYKAEIKIGKSVEHVFIEDHEYIKITDTFLKFGDYQVEVNYVHDPECSLCAVEKGE